MTIIDVSSQGHICEMPLINCYSLQDILCNYKLHCYVIISPHVITSNATQRMSGTKLCSNLDDDHTLACTTCTACSVHVAVLDEWMQDNQFQNQIVTKQQSALFLGYAVNLNSYRRGRPDPVVIRSAELIQDETALLCNDVSHWLGANLESALDPGNKRLVKQGWVLICLYYSGQLLLLASITANSKCTSP